MNSNLFLLVAHSVMLVVYTVMLVAILGHRRMWRQERAMKWAFVFKRIPRMFFFFADFSINRFFPADFSINRFLLHNVRADDPDIRWKKKLAQACDCLPRYNYCHRGTSWLCLCYSLTYITLTWSRMGD